MKYLRIGTEYYKELKKPLPSGGFSNELARWKKSEIITDEGKHYLESIEKYDGFVCIPSHIKFRQVIEGFYNKYYKVQHTALAGDFENTKVFLKHIFEEHYELALDYITILWRFPEQILPILCLVSNERNTGKSTFINFMKLIFQDNLTVNTNDDFRGRFNSDWATKLLICIDEVLLEKREDSERLKHLSTAKTYKMEAKGIDKVEIPFFGKIILCTNNEDSFICTDEKEIRYWVRKVKPIQKEKPDLLDSLKRELPHFIFFLNNRKIKSEKKTRMWFNAEEIHTIALDNLLSGNENSIVRELKQLLNEEFDKFGVEELKYTATDLVNKLKEVNNFIR